MLADLLVKLTGAGIKNVIEKNVGGEEADGGVDQTIITGITAGIEAVINRALRYDPATQQKVAQLNQVLAVTITQPNVTFYICGQTDKGNSDNSGVRIMNHCEDSITTHLTGSITALFSLLKKPTTLANSGVELVGSTQLLQEWQSILQSLDIDWEDAISQILGDIAGPLTADSLRKAKQWFTQQTDEHQRLVTEYLPEELKVTPSKTEVNEFYQEIDKLKLSTDRISARINILMNKVKDKGTL